MRGLRKWQRLQLGKEKKAKVHQEDSMQGVVLVLGVKGKISNDQFLENKRRKVQRQLLEEGRSVKE